MENKIRVIAYYLPQFHPIHENDIWWGNGFTEWTNVRKARSLFRGHKQPVIPGELGYYDLRDKSIRDKQAKLAKEAGIEGFMYWHYWFGNGKRLLENVFNDVLESGEPDFPFCLGWANHSWYAKNWNSDSTKGEDRLLIKQEYLGVDDFRMHFDCCLDAFNDKRYIKIDEKPVFLIYDTESLPLDFIGYWNKWAKETGFSKGIYFIATVKTNKYSKFADVNKWKLIGYDAVVVQRVYSVFNSSLFNRLFSTLKSFVFKKIGYPVGYVKYNKAIKYLVNEDQESLEDVLPVIIPNFDHSPRSKYAALVFDKVTPKLFEKHVRSIFKLVKIKKNKVVFLRSWNEWGEGNYLEPDSESGKIYIETLDRLIKEYENN
ncbi:MAG: glycoside hydrolase family 99-like domain-containing protein [Paludibacter sp.]|nr:glycoside hydrolase family 99-like domain-containing protein [Paludibacter sp.]